ncbi:hypothetical protein PI124_g17979 [Phytophthora idaei]|nr:hypothetical protein PI125_g22931 [Phytophthora idaei]KAG3129255.1 hypothetical protein PI126_g21050 [Phytophthora idaei]KAG3237018.1 hypothetical protein PI124_g17979 [Phytophthora idaei]
MRQLGVGNVKHTLDKALAVAARFKVEALSKLTVERIAQVDAVVGTIPIQADFQLPDLLVAQHTDRSEVWIVVLDAAFMPRITPILPHAPTGGRCVVHPELHEVVRGGRRSVLPLAQVRAVNSCADESFPRSQE